MDFQEEPGRIFAMQDGTLIAEITFPEQDGVAVFDHTFVDGSLRGRGVADQLIRAAVRQVRGRGGKARLVCSYARSWFANHPEEADLLER